MEITSFKKFIHVYQTSSWRAHNVRLEPDRSPGYLPGTTAIWKTLLNITVLVLIPLCLPNRIKGKTLEKAFALVH